MNNNNFNYSKNLIYILLTILLFNSCGVIKYTAEFNSAKSNNDIVLVYNEIKSVEKAKAINVLLSKYLDSAPEDKELKQLINQHIKYNLDLRGFKNIVLKQDFKLTQQTNEITYELVFDKLLLREFKASEAVRDSESGTSDKVKLKGIETKVSGDVFLLKNKLPIEGMSKKVKDSERETESHTGEFKNTKNLKEHILQESSSMKYLADVNDLEDGLFQNQCISVAEKIAEEINKNLVLAYIKYKRKCKKELKK
jgi:PBP1b-binding outer membrane lipoprotein LpoB